MGLWASRWANDKKLTWALALSMLLGSNLLAQTSFAQTARVVNAPIGISAAAAESSTSSRSARLTLRVYNYAGMDSASLIRSEKIADKILQKEGIETVWVDCPTSTHNTSSYPACDTPRGPADFVLRILPRPMAVKLRRSQDSLGSAQICPTSEPSCELNLFYHRIDELAAKGYRGDRILGYAIVHEIAHILLGPAHSEDGIMRADWTPSDLERISLGLELNFAADESKQLRVAVLKRAASPRPDGAIHANLIAPYKHAQ